MKVPKVYVSQKEKPKFRKLESISSLSGHHVNHIPVPKSEHVGYINAPILLVNHAKTLTVIIFQFLKLVF
jgi:hypothetical protein